MTMAQTEIHVIHIKIILDNNGSAKVIEATCMP